MKHNEELIENIASEVQDEYQMGGLAEGLYLDFAKDVSKRYAEQLTTPDVSDSLSNWKSFRAGFEAARDCWNEKYASEPGSVKWKLLPDKLISNAWWRWSKGNYR